MEEPTAKDLSPFTPRFEVRADDVVVGQLPEYLRTHYSKGAELLQQYEENLRKFRSGETPWMADVRKVFEDLRYHWYMIFKDLHELFPQWDLFEIRKDFVVVARTFMYSWEHTIPLQPMPRGPFWYN